MEGVARSKGFRLLTFQASDQSELEKAFASAVRDHADALLISADPFFTTRRNQIVALAARQGLPVVYPFQEYTYGNDITRAQALAQELVGLQPDIIVTSTTEATVSVQRETRTIPIVFGNVAEPVASGIVARLDRPNGNITGFASFEASLRGKWVEVLSEIAPGLKRAAIMFRPGRISFNPDAAASILLPFETAALLPIEKAYLALI
jgi:ABC-type uncharacterized transport system substrate-binding protein